MENWTKQQLSDELAFQMRQLARTQERIKKISHILYNGRNRRQDDQEEVTVSESDMALIKALLG